MVVVKVSVVVLCLCLYAHASPIIAMTSPLYPFNFYTRADWKGLNSTDVRPLRQPVPYVVIHHTYLPAACYKVDDCAAKMRSMQNYHISLDWGDIGYNFCVGSEGGAYEGRGWDNRGIHTGKANNYSIGICLIGDWRVTLSTANQLETTKALIAEGVKQGKVDPNYKLIAHNQVMNTECPGEALLEEISTWKHFAPGEPDFSTLADKRSDTN